MPASLQTLLDAFDANLPLARARTIPASWYVDPAFADFEIEAVFAGGWVVAGRVDQVAAVGQYFTCDIAGRPVLVVRDESHTLRALANVCRHRAAVLLPDAGCVSKLRCRYHGWTYDLTGRLRGVPEFADVEAFCREEAGLPAYAVETCGPFVGVHLGTPTESFAEALAPLPAWMSAHAVTELKFARRVEYELDCNWKVFLDNYLDGGYHVRTVHPELASVLDESGYRVTLYDRTNVQTCPLESAEMTSEVTRTRQGTEAAYWWAYPHFMLNHYAGVMDTNTVWPIGANRCRVVFDYYFAVDTPEARIAESIAVADRIQAEDVGICMDVQRGLTGGSFTSGRYAVRREGGAYQFHQLLARRLHEAFDAKEPT